MAEKVFSDEELRRAAKERVARLFNVSPNSIAFDDAFGEELKGSYVSDWKLNELDLILEDIHDVADAKIKKELGSGVTVIRTVGDYCEYMVRCYHTKPNEVVRVLWDE